MELINLGLYEIIQPEEENIILDKEEYWQIYDSSLPVPGQKIIIHKRMVGKKLMSVGEGEPKRMPILYHSGGEMYHCPPCIIRFVRKVFDIREILQYLGDHQSIYRGLLQRNSMEIKMLKTSPLDGHYKDQTVIWLRENHGILRNLYGMELKEILRRVANGQTLKCPHCGTNYRYNQISRLESVSYKLGTAYYNCPACNIRLKLVINTMAERLNYARPFATEVVRVSKKPARKETEEIENPEEHTEE